MYKSYLFQKEDDYMKKVMKLLTMAFTVICILATSIPVGAAGVVDSSSDQGVKGIVSGTSQAIKYSSPNKKEFYISARTVNTTVNKIVLKYSLKYYTTGDSITSNTLQKTNTNFYSYTVTLSNTTQYSNKVTNFSTHEAIHDTSYTVYLSVAV